MKAAYLQQFYRIAAAALCAGIAACCGFAGWQLLDPLNAPILIPMSEVFYARALAAPEASNKVVWAEKAIDAAPRRAENWTLAAYAYQTADKKVSDRVIESLRRSYEVAPYSPDAHDSRIAHVFMFWSDMPPDIRSRCMNEAEAYANRHDGVMFLKGLQDRVYDPAGRFALGAILLKHKYDTRALSLRDVNPRS